ncbi:hypothetical protein [Azospirillum isscasi]|uniref:Transposase n=1 Tax=Azospirillum isscasi TaxID=3053926 RepID=A0ABU0WF15_9PROT|nr:hypothetical protein [Azospirillum isscasi]MDQ2102502.1 hypothetical protein [Azospirillum isscasi]
MEDRSLSRREGPAQETAPVRCVIAPRRIYQMEKSPSVRTRRTGHIPADIQEGKAMLGWLRFSLEFRKTASGWRFRFAVEYLI